MNDEATQAGGEAGSKRKRLRDSLYVASWILYLPSTYLSVQPDFHSAAFLLGIAWIITLVMWCREDALLSKRPLPTLSLWLIFLIWPIGVPVCVIRLYGVFYGLLLIGLHLMIYAAVTFLAAFLFLAF